MRGLDQNMAQVIMHLHGTFGQIPEEIQNLLYFGLQLWQNFSVINKGSEPESK